ncbi:transcription factor bHLH52-like [Cannabis sativa]|uniref:BHLH domain-containing protein n=1 Tax=Cannabis sativa TaxID=3483 RepID=A0A7J6I5A1_CANSA|nr:transcription factor bHLH52-like [Cannabis sativa]KAF4402703.1 hypothetical protein G4B88_012488 [Cannabis sativa]
MALTFCSNNFPPCYPNSHHQNLINPDTVVFPQTKKQRSSSTLSFLSNTYSFTTNHNVDPLTLHPPQPLFFSNPTNPTNHNPFFSSPQPPYSPFQYDYYYDHPNTNNNLDYSGPGFPSDHPEMEFFINSNEPYYANSDDPNQHIDDQLLLAPLLPEQVAVADNYLDQNQQVMMINNNNIYSETAAEMVITGADHVSELKRRSSSSSKVVSPQSMAARERRRKIAEKTQELGKLIPGGNKMTTAEMFQAASKYVHFLKAQISVLQEMGKEEVLKLKELEVLTSPIVQERLYSEEKCLVPKGFIGRSTHNQTNIITS